MAVAITGGRFRGAVLTTPAGQKLTRPTSGKVRQALFNILRGRIEGGEFLDLYAGSGAVGFEALSRGCRKIVLVESHASAFRALISNRRNLEARGAEPESMECIRDDALEFSRQCVEKARRFDTIFADPPFGEEIPELGPELTPLLTPDGIGIVQFPSRHPPGWLTRAVRTYVYGESSLAVFAAGHF